MEIEFTLEELKFTAWAVRRTVAREEKGIAKLEARFGDNVDRSMGAFHRLAMGRQVRNKLNRAIKHQNKEQE